MVSADLVRAAVFLLLCLPMPTPLLLVLTVTAGLAAPPFAAARSAAVAEVVPADVLPRAIGLSQVTGDVAIVLGNLSAGLVLAALGPTPALAMNALTFLASAALLHGLPALIPDGAARTARLQLKAGFTALITDRPVVLAAVIATICASAATAIESLTVPYSAHAAPDVRWLPGVILAGVAVVTIVGTLLCPLDGRPDQLLRTTVLIGVFGSALCLGMLSAPLPTVRLAGLVATGLLYVPLVSANVLVTPRLSASCRASAMGVLMGLLAGTQAALTALLGGLAELTSPRTAAAAVLTLSLLCVFGCAATMRIPMRVLRTEQSALAGIPSDEDQPVEAVAVVTLPDVATPDRPAVSVGGER